MAYCTNCGREIGDNDKFCTGCGKAVMPPAKEKLMTPVSVRVSSLPLRFTRQPSLAFGARALDIMIDGEYAATVNNSGTVYVQVAVGRHAVYFTVGGVEFGSDTVEIRGDTQEPFYELKIAADGLSGRVYCTNTNCRPVQPVPVRMQAPAQRMPPVGRLCPRCGGLMLVQTVAESRRTGCLTVLLYIILAITLLGLLIVIPLALRRKTQTVTYAVCQSCGYKQTLSIGR